MRKEFLLFLFLIVLGCNPKPSAVIPNYVKNVNAEGLHKAERKICNSGEVLKEFDNNPKAKAYNNISDYNLFSFVNGNSTCALTKGYKKDGIFYEWFSLSISNDCIKNGSLWIIKSISRASNTVNITFVPFEEVVSPQEVSLYAGYDVSLNTLYNEVTMHFLKCSVEIEK